MPDGLPPLSQSVISSIELWINNSVLNNKERNYHEKLKRILILVCAISLVASEWHVDKSKANIAEYISSVYVPENRVVHGITGTLLITFLSTFIYAPMIS